MPSYRNSDPRPPIMEGAPPPPEYRVPRLDWDRPPWNRWTFRNVSQMVPTAVIRRGALASALVGEGGDLGALAYDSPAGGRGTVAGMLDETYTDGFLVMLDGRIVHESYHNGMDARSLHLLQSVSKSLTATAGAGLIEAGVLDPMAPVTDYLPELRATAWNGATLRHVLDMTTGVRYSESYEERDSDMGKTDVACGWKPVPPGRDPADFPANIWDQILSLTELEVPHGSRFLYRSIETDVLAHTMERVTGQPLPQILSERLWSPIGAAEDANITVDANGYGLACGGVSATLRDLARFGLAMLNDGMVEGRQAIPRFWVDDVRAGDHGMFSPEGRANMPNGRYRNQFWILDAARTTHLCLGVFGQMIYVAPDQGMVAVKLSTWPTFLSDRFMAETLAALNAIHAAHRS
jgi:CubicO group peptidase (beta-lactamase class C family)